MDKYIIAGILMLIAWAYVTITSAAPGWIHLLLTGGVFLVIYGIVQRKKNDRT